VLTDQKILVTGPAGQIAFPLAKALAKDNDVWGIARFSKDGGRDVCEAAGIKTRVADLATGDFSNVPDDFTYVLHLAAYIAPGADYDGALRVNAEGTGLLLTHCRKAKAALVMTTTSCYKPNPDPWRPYVETDPLGDASLAAQPTYSISKISDEAVARFCARQLNLPVVITRMNAAYGPVGSATGSGGLQGYHCDTILAGETVNLRTDPCPYSLIHERDIYNQVEALLGAASVPATIVNWGGDQAITAKEWCTYMGELNGTPAKLAFAPTPVGQLGVINDNAKRLSITGPCQVDWRDGIKEMFEARKKRLAVKAN
jgi:nucleoside-diphosphate-sugar epimerase